MVFILGSILPSPSVNMQSALQHSSVVEEYLEKEVSMHRIAGPLGDTVAGVHINKFGVIPKNHHPGEMENNSGPVFP